MDVGDPDTLADRGEDETMITSSFLATAQGSFWLDPEVFGTAASPSGF